MLYRRSPEPSLCSAMKNVVAEALGPAEEMLGVLEKNWADDQFARGAYSLFYPPAVMSSFWPAMQEIFETNRLGQNLWIAGADYSLEWIGYMNGAILAGETVALKIVQNLHQGHEEIISSRILEA